MVSKNQGIECELFKADSFESRTWLAVHSINEESPLTRLPNEPYRRAMPAVSRVDLSFTQFEYDKRSNGTVVFVMIECFCSFFNSCSSHTFLVVCLTCNLETYYKSTLPRYFVFSPINVFKSQTFIDTSD